MALLGSAIISFTITTSMVLGQKEPQTSFGEVIVLDTLEAAESEAGTQIHTPSHIPIGFEQGKILISRFDTRDQEPVVLQTWHRKSDGAFFFIQESSTLAGFVGEASDATLGTKQVRYSASPAHELRDFGLNSYFWSQDGKGIVLTLLDTDAIDNDMKEQIANSVGARP